MEALKSEIESIKLQIQRLCNFAETNVQSTPSSSSTQPDVISRDIQQVLEVLNRIDNKLNELTTTSSTSPLIPYSTNTTSPHPAPTLEHRTLKPLTKDDLGPNLIAKLAELERNPHFRGKVRVSIADLGVDWREFAKRARPFPDHEQYAVQHERDGDGFSRLYLARSKTMPFIDFDFDLDSLTHDQAVQYVNKTVDSPPPGIKRYFVGSFETSGTPLASLFPSGALSILGNLPGINTLYMHMGERGSGTAFHCEDAHLRSYNLNIYGWKLWIMIDPDDTAKFEGMLATKFPLHKCDQSVRHLNVMVSPERLREEGIKFDIIRAGPGDLVITQPRQYHAVLNQTPSLAIATNYTLHGEQAIPPGWVVCPRDGLYSLSHDNLIKLPDNPPMKKRKSNATLSLPPHSKRQKVRQSRGISNVAGNNIVKPRYYQDNEEQNKQQDEQQDEEDGEGYAQRHDQQQEQQDNQEEDEEEEEEEEEDKEEEEEEEDKEEEEEEDDEEEEEENEVHDHQHNQEHNEQQHQAQYKHQKHGNNENGNQNSNTKKADTDIELGRQLASLTIDNSAILRFMSIVHAWNSADAALKRSFASKKPTDQLLTAKYYDNQRQKAQNLGILYTVLSMSASFRLSKVITKDKQRRRASSACISAVLEGRGIKVTEKARNDLSREMYDARAIMKLVEGYDGLLCFLPLGFGSGFTLKALTRLSNIGIETFRTTVTRHETLMLLSEVGNEFLLSIWGEGEFKERLFQRKQVGELRNLPSEDLIKFLTPIQPEDSI